MTDVWKLLPYFSWRGERYPLATRSVTFAHEEVAHKFQFQDDALIEQLGAGSFTFSYMIPMREDIAKGPYKNLFAVGLSKLLKDFRDRTPGLLVDPVYGEFRCVPKLYTDDSDPNKRDGTDIRVEFTYAPEQQSTETTTTGPNIGSIVADSGQLEVQLQQVDWEQQEPPDGMTDILSGINGIMRRGLNVVDKLSYSLDDLSFRLQKIEDTIDAVENPQNWRLRQSVRATREATHRLKEQLTENPLIKIKKLTTRYTMTVSSVASNVGMTVEALLALNPGLAISPKVPKGTVINTG